MRTPTLVRVFAAAIVAAFAIGFGCGGEGVTPPPPPPPPIQPPPPPPPPPPAAPIIQKFVIEPDSIGFSIRDSARITITVENMTAPCIGSGAWSGNVAVPTTSGKVSPNTTSDYTVSCTNAGGTVSATRRLKVAPPPPPGERADKDRPRGLLDGDSDHTVQFAYYVPADGEDRQVDIRLDDKGIKMMLARAMPWFAAEAGVVPRLDTWQGQPDILYVRSSKTKAQIGADGIGFAVIYNDLSSMGLINERKKLIVLLDQAPGIVMAGAAALGGPLGIVQISVATFFDGSLIEPLWYVPGAKGRTSFHELGHAAGLVHPGAPDHMGPMSHSSVQTDLMCGYPGPCEPRLDSVVDVLRRSYVGANVPPGVTNLLSSPWFVLASAELIAEGRELIHAAKELQTLRAPSIAEWAELRRPDVVVPWPPGGLP